MEPKWLIWARELQSIAQNGLTYTQNVFDIERFEAVQKIAEEILNSYTDVPTETLHDLFAVEKGYATPKIDVRGAVFKDNQILLVRELMDGGRWTLPGGWADVDDSPSEAVLREIREESGYEAKVLQLAAVYDRRKHDHPFFYFSIYKLFFVCELTGGAPTQSIETGGSEFFSEQDLPELSVSRVTAAEIHQLFEHYRHPELPTEFD